MTENEFLLTDRITKIKSINDMYDLEHNAYISFSGGKDSTVLSALIDMALPNNEIPRVYSNTGIEYKEVVNFVKELQKTDKRILIINPSKNIKDMLNEYGYPFKSKEFSHILSIFQNSGYTKYVLKYLNPKEETRYKCPTKLKYLFTDKNKQKISDKCCYKLKKQPMKDYEEKSGRKIYMTGMREQEGGQRTGMTCVIMKDSKLKAFHPLAPVTDDFIEWFVKTYDIKLCKLYYPPFNFKRTGCKGCPYSIDLQNQLDVMSILLPEEKKQCELIWKPVYQEYRRINYRLNKQLNLFD